MHQCFLYLAQLARRQFSEFLPRQHKRVSSTLPSIKIPHNNQILFLNIIFMFWCSCLFIFLLPYLLLFSFFGVKIFFSVFSLLFLENFIIIWYSIIFSSDADPYELLFYGSGNSPYDLDPDRRKIILILIFPLKFKRSK